MKKILSFLAVLCMSVMLASAQTVESSRLFENTYVTAFGGGATTQGFFNQDLTPFFWDGARGIAKNVRPVVGLELGKYITPVTGFSIQGIGFINSTYSNTFFDESAVLFNGKLNFSNWFGGYKGQPRRLEVVGVAGLGWGHDYLVEGQEYALPETDPNYVTYNTSAELNLNLGEARAWQLSLRPGVLWANKDNLPGFNWKTDARPNVMVGVTYKFGSKKKGHNFRLCPYKYTAEEYNQLLAENDFLKNNPTVVEKPVVKEVPVTKEVVVKETRVLVGSTVITFPIGSCALSSVERAKVAMFAKSLDADTLIQIVGSADTQTGTETRNFALAQNRANVVKNVLVTDFGISEDRITVNTKMDATEDVETSRSAILTLSVE